MSGRPPETGAEVGRSENIWVYVENQGSAPARVVLELLAKARELAPKTGGAVEAVLLGGDVRSLAGVLFAYGAERVILAEDPLLADYKPVPYAETLKTLAERHRPSIILFGATAQGRDLAPRLQGKLLTGLTSDCLDLDIDDRGLLVQTKPSYGDGLMCTIICPEARPQMATVRPRTFAPRGEDPAARGELVEETVAVAEDESYQILAKTPAPEGEADIRSAERLVVLGRGAGSEEAVAAARELAVALGAGLAVTRPLADGGLFPHQAQIGQSGRTVQPKCLINFGVSGAIQYAVGIREAGFVASVDKNPEAPIFGFSHVGYAGEALEMIKALNQEIINRKKL